MIWGALLWVSPEMIAAEQHSAGIAPSISIDVFALARFFSV
jgi:hypothetical protein